MKMLVKSWGLRLVLAMRVEAGESHSRQLASGNRVLVKRHSLAASAPGHGKGRRNQRTFCAKVRWLWRPGPWPGAEAVTSSAAGPAGAGAARGTAPSRRPAPARPPWQQRRWGAIPYLSSHTEQEVGSGASTAETVRRASSKYVPLAVSDAIRGHVIPGLTSPVVPTRTAPMLPARSPGPVSTLPGPAIGSRLRNAVTCTASEWQFGLERTIWAPRTSPAGKQWGWQAKCLSERVLRHVNLRKMHYEATGPSTYTRKREKKQLVAWWDNSKNLPFLPSTSNLQFVNIMCPSLAGAESTLRNCPAEWHPARVNKLKTRLWTDKRLPSTDNLIGHVCSIFALPLWVPLSSSDKPQTPPLRIKGSPVFMVE